MLAWLFKFDIDGTVYSHRNVLVGKKYEQSLMNQFTVAFGDVFKVLMSYLDMYANIDVYAKIIPTLEY